MWLPHPTYSLSCQLVLRKSEVLGIQDSQACGSWAMAAHTALIQKAPPGAVQNSSTAVINLKHKVASATFFTGQCSLRDLRGPWDHLIKLPSHPG